MEYLWDILTASYRVAEESGIYLFLGFLVAGLMKGFLNGKTINRFMGQQKTSSVFRAALIGIPLPLCSCSVIPVARSLKDHGATNGAVSAFLISTPETGVDSISISYGLLGPIITVFRPLSALITSILAGLAQNYFDVKQNASHSIKHVDNPDKPLIDQSCCSTDEGISSVSEDKRPKMREKLIHGMNYAFKDLLPDIAVPLAYGILISGLLLQPYILPNDFFNSYLQQPIFSMFLMLIIGLPIYTCATSSTPIAAALILKGLNPGAALVFLLVGPATNIITMTTVMKTMGRKGLVIYLLSITLTAIFSGLLLNLVFTTLSIKPDVVIGSHSDLLWDGLKRPFGILLSVYLLYALLKKVLRKIKSFIGGRTG